MIAVQYLVPMSRSHFRVRIQVDEKGQIHDGGGVPNSGHVEKQDVGWRRVVRGTVETFVTVDGVLKMEENQFKGFSSFGKNPSHPTFAIY